MSNCQIMKSLIVDNEFSDIVKKIISGDKQSFEIVYRYYYPKLNYFARQYLPDSETSNKVVQEVFTELWDSIKPYVATQICKLGFLRLP